jgi:hypothetical protein
MWQQMVAFGFAQGHEEPDLVDTLSARLLSAAEQLDGAPLCDVLWSLSVFGRLSPDCFAHLCAQLERQPLRAFEPQVSLP